MVMHEPPPEGFEGSQWIDDDNGDVYSRDTEGKWKIKVRDIEEVILYSPGANWRRNMLGISNIGNTLSQVGLGLTLSVAGSEIGLLLMAIGGAVSTVADVINTFTYAFENNWDRFGKEAVITGTSIVFGRMTDGALKAPARNGKGAASKEVIEVTSYLQGELIQPIIEKSARTY